MMLWHAEFEARHNFFDAFGTTRREALDAMKASLAVHGRQYNLPDSWWDAFSIGDDAIAVREVSTGKGYRNREPL